jgi:perosamine synthetase
MGEMIPFSLPVMDGREADAVRETLLSRWVTQGPQVAAFEREFAEYTGAPHACAVSNCTTALHLALRAVGVGPGDEVVTVSHSYIGTANAVRYCGALPVFADIEPGTYNIDPGLIDALITPKTRAILAVHQMGMPCDLTAILGIADRLGIPVVEDAACALGSEFLFDGAWERIGRPRGEIACFSFHPRKMITTGDGGMLTTRNAGFDAKFRLWRHHGMDLTDAARHGSDRVIFERYPELGYNYRMTDIQAAVGRIQLSRMPQFFESRRELGRRYRELLAPIPGLGLPREPEWARGNWQSYCVQLPEGVDQRSVMQALLDEGIATRRGVMCAHREEAYRGASWSCGEGPSEICGCAPLSCRRLPVSEAMQDRCILLPIFHEMSAAQQEVVADALSRILAGNRSGNA